MPGPRDRYTAPKAARRKSLRTPLVLLVLVPSLALVGLWGTTAAVLVTESVHLRDDADRVTSAGRPAYTVLTRLQDERRLTAAWQAAPRSGTRPELADARSRTDDAVKEFRTAAAGLEAADTDVKSRARDMGTSLEELAQQRDAIDERTLNREQAFEHYTGTIAHGTRLLRAVTAVDDAGLARRAGGLNSLVQLSEMVSREDALLAGVQKSDGMAAETRAGFAQHVAVQRETTAALDAQELPGDQKRAYRRITGGGQWAELAAYEDALTTGQKKLPEQDAWRERAEALGKDLRELNSEELRDLTDGGSDRATELLFWAALGTVVVLAALTGTAVLTRRFSGSLFGRLSRLHFRTTELADARLPQIVEELGRGEHDPPAARPWDGDQGREDEVARVAEATHHLEQAVHATLLQQARGREGTEQIFLGLARRTQVLISRLIPKLDELERKHQDSELLKDIFAVDHLATRMRRHTENLVILGGSPPVRRWSKAVPIYEVLRSAISETEDYRRVEVQPAPPVSLLGPAVADVVHLLAELIENGTSFSPPETKVCVTAAKVARGVALEVEDRGLGMPDERYELANRLLAEPPKLDMLKLGETPRLGLFVVARLARRHNLEISLRKSPYGGTQAIVLLPGELLEETQSLLSSIMPQQGQKTRDATAPGTEAAAPLPERAPELERAHAAAEMEPEHHTPGYHAPAYHTPQQHVAEHHTPEQQPETAALELAVGHGAGLVAHPSFDAEGGFPSYGGAGLLPSTPDEATEQTPAAYPAVQPWSADGAYTDTGHATPPTGNEMSQDSPAEVTPPSTLPTRVRGESLAAPLRREESAPEPDDSPGPVSPERSGAAIAAIQAANKRVRPKPAESAGAHDPQAERPVHGVRPEDH